MLNPAKDIISIMRKEMVYNKELDKTSRNKEHIK